MLGGSVIRRTIGTVKAVSDVAFSVRRGETFGLVGESGCGKTTVGRLIVALERPDAGHHRVRGRTTCMRWPEGNCARAAVTSS